MYLYDKSWTNRSYEVASLEFKAEVGGGGESLEVLLMQSNGQSATTEELTALECCDNPTVSGYFCQMITHTFQEYMLNLFTMGAAASTFTWNSNVTACSQKPGSQRCWFLRPKCSRTHSWASLIPNLFPRVIPRAPVKRGRGGQGKDAPVGRPSHVTCSLVTCDLAGCNETRSVGAQPVRALWTLPLEYTCSQFHLVQFMCCEQTLISNHSCSVNSKQKLPC